MRTSPPLPGAQLGGSIPPAAPPPPGRAVGAAPPPHPVLSHGALTPPQTPTHAAGGALGEGEREAAGGGRALRDGLGGPRPAPAAAGRCRRPGQRRWRGGERSGAELIALPGRLSRGSPALDPPVCTRAALAQGTGEGSTAGPGPSRRPLPPRGERDARRRDGFAFRDREKARSRCWELTGALRDASAARLGPSVSTAGWKTNSVRKRTTRHGEGSFPPRSLLSSRGDGVSPDCCCQTQEEERVWRLARGFERGLTCGSQKLPWEVVAAPSLEACKARLDGPLSNLV